MRKRPAFHGFALLATVALASCASSGGAGRATTGVLTAEQLDNLGPGVTAYDAIEQLRPTWLRERGNNSPSAVYADDTLPRVHVDTTPYGVSALRTFRTSDIQSISFMDGRDATTRYGTGYVNGLILVTTRTGVSRPPGGR